MKKNIKICSIIIAAAFVMAGCSDSFLDRPPQDSIAASTAYSSDAQVMANNALLYNRVWFDYNDYAAFSLPNFRGGDAATRFKDMNNVWFNTLPETGENGNAWRAFYVTIGQANTALNNIQKYAGPNVSPEIKQNAIGEARFMRALAYRYLVMNWGAIPILTDNEAILGDPLSVQPNTVSSVWRFICSEMRQAAEELPEQPYGTNSSSWQAPGGSSGRVTKWSAEGMLARFYLTRAGVESDGGTRNQQFLDSAKYFAQDVITKSGKTLLPNYRDLFLYPYNNNNESLFELQWEYIPKTQTWYTLANSSTSQYGPDGSIMNISDGWGGDVGATFWMLSLYDGFTQSIIPSTSPDNPSDTLVLKGSTKDQRLHETYMLPGAVYPEITRTLNGEDQKPFVVPFSFGGPTFAGSAGSTSSSQAWIKKYIVGQSKDAGPSDSQDYGNDTYMLRLAELYLIYADAALGNQASTADATALDYFNRVHTRAGLTAVTTPLTYDDIFKEKVLEFGFEGMMWYLLIDLHYWNPQKAYDILGSQYRGFYSITPNVYPNPTSWTVKTFPNSSGFHKISDYVTANDGNFNLPLPAAEVSQAPNLKGTPVDYYGDK